MSDLPDPQAVNRNSGGRADRLLGLLERIALALELRPPQKSRGGETFERQCAYSGCAKLFTSRNPRKKFCCSTHRVYAFDARAKAKAERG